MIQRTTKVHEGRTLKTSFVTIQTDDEAVEDVRRHVKNVTANDNIAVHLKFHTIIECVESSKDVIVTTTWKGID